MDIKVEKPKSGDLEKAGVFNWPVWEKEISKFDWSYTRVEECYILEGKASVKCGDGKTVSFGKGDFVTFPKGLSCVWDIMEPIKKHYNFR